MNSKEKNDLASNDKNFPILNNGIELFSIILISVIVLVLFFSIFNIYLGTGSPVAVTTTSMSPVYGGYIPDLEFDEAELRKHYLPLDGDLLVLKKQTPLLGDTIVFKSENAHNQVPIVHRIIAIQTNFSSQNYYLTKGDNNIETDYTRFGWISDDQVIGVVIGKIPSISWLSLEIQNITMRLFLIIGLGVIILLMLFQEENQLITKKNVKDLKRSSGFFSKLKMKYFYIWKRNKNSFTISKILSTPKGNILTVLIIISTIFLSFSIQKSINAENGVKILALNDPESVSTGPNNIGTGFYFIHFDLEINSRGIFNWVHKIELRLNGAENDVVNTWNIQYSFEGKLIIKSGFPISQDIITSTGNYSINLYYTIYSQGLLAQEQVTEVISLNYSI